MTETIVGEGDEFQCVCGRWEAILNARSKAPGAPPVCRRCAVAVPDAARDCDECGDVIGYDGAISYGDGTIRHYPECDEVMRARRGAGEVRS